MLIATAGRLFGDQGFTAVGMEQVAATINVRPAALYRHMASKNALLLAATEASLAPLLEAVADPDRLLDEILPQMARATAADRGGARLWIREFRHLEAEGRQLIEEEIGSLVSRLSHDLVHERGDPPPIALRRARAVLMTFASAAFHGLEPSQRRLESFLTRAARRLADVSLPALQPMKTTPPQPERTRRRDQLLAGAIELFAARGYATVSVEEIASAAGIASGTFYSHFSGKRQLLAAAISEAESLLRDEIDRALPPDGDPALSLRRLLEQYIRMVTTRPDITTILVNDSVELDQAERLQAGRVIDDLVNRWASLVRSVVGCSSTEARMRGHATLWVVHGLTLWPPIGEAADEAFVLAAASSVLFG
ncbi:TetR/AcrR family transcriptional regulator [Leifsonia sp. ZF2019]|uniref:TetR/AcrR family transcriptional regulator n=1 Tax=Leifsonia sp. ZF2019 TaxID=2781978 RepID=UPI001CBC1D7B|nr:TetR/AcrR family transcriptional regulator [Leifsonia sp. ZF2019]UAJ79326.1 TetR/AcrR family transcriptional regulator [Leifsonia sp. ZF2019]